MKKVERGKKYKYKQSIKRKNVKLAGSKVTLATKLTGNDVSSEGMLQQMHIITGVLEDII
jgi:hypothetical protein